MSQNVIIRPKLDFSNTADNCYSDHVLSDKFPAKSSKLTQEYIDFCTERGSACLRQEAMDWKDQNQITFAQ